jgi:hypothetical protein
VKRYNQTVVQHIKAVSGFFFYLLGISFFLAYLLAFNMLWAPWPRWWMDIADLPLAFSACVYGGASLYMSITQPDKHSKIAAFVIGLPLLAVLLFFVALNFWDVLH